MEEVVPGGSIDFKRPLEATEKLTDAFSEGARYHPTGEEVKPLYGLLIEFKRYIANLGDFMNFSSYSGYGDYIPSSNSVALIVSIVALVVVPVLLWYGMKWVWRYMGWDWCG